MWSADAGGGAEGPVCRGCLSSDVRLYNVHENRLVESYVQLVGISLQDGLSQQLCAWCGAWLRRFALFRERARRAAALLAAAAARAQPISIYLEDIDIRTYSRLKPAHAQTATHTHDYVGGRELVCKQEGGGEVKEEGEEDGGELGAEKKEVDEIKKEYSESDEARCAEAFVLELDARRGGEGKVEVKLKVKRGAVKKQKSKKPRAGAVCRAPSSPEEAARLADEHGFDVRFLTIDEQLAEVEEKKRKNMMKRGATCQQCGKSYPDADKLRAHARRDHAPARAHACRVCRAAYQHASRLAAHAASHATEYQCRRCGACTKRYETLKYHKMAHDGKQHKCQYCEKVFAKVTTYFSHVRLAHAARLPWCELCGESFVNERGIKFHKSRVHAGESATLACATCEARFTSGAARRRHGPRCTAGPRACCARCGDDFPSAQLLKYHLIQRHRTNMPLIECQSCSTAFHNAAALERHAALCAGPAPPGPAGDVTGPAGDVTGPAWCVQCGAACADVRALDEHAAAHHDAAERFKCEECDKTFLNAFYYRDHFDRLHRGARAGAVRRARGPGSRGGGRGGVWRPADDGRDVTASRRDVTPPPRRLGAVCEVCGKAFPCRARLETHLSTHSAERAHHCTVCGKSFRTPLALECHTRVHTGERPYQCPLCPKAFKMQPALVRHHLVHSGVRAHVCQVCSKSFQTSTSVKLHVRSVHMKIPAPPRLRRRRPKDD